MAQRCFLSLLTPKARESLYFHALRDDYDEYLRHWGTTTIKLEGMPSFARALIPKKKLYCEFFSYILRLENGTNTKYIAEDYDILATSFVYPSISPLMFNSIRNITIVVPGSPVYFAQWTPRPASTLDDPNNLITWWNIDSWKRMCAEFKTFSTEHLSHILLGGLDGAPNLDNINFVFKEPIRGAILMSRRDEPDSYKDLENWQLSTKTFGRYINDLPNLKSITMTTEHRPSIHRASDNPLLNLLAEFNKNLNVKTSLDEGPFSGEIEWVICWRVSKGQLRWIEHVEDSEMKTT